MFKFIHAADIHLDSPLRGLERYEGAPVEQIRQATRRALANLVELAIDEQVAFVLIAGDLYDGDWPDYNTGLYMIGQLRKLREAGIPVFLISGNHDADNKMTLKLDFTGVAELLPTDAPETRFLEDVDVAIHGQGFATAAVTEDLSQRYPPAVTGYFNVGMLHTCASGLDGHAPYAPCRLDGLRAKQYDYWALGHVHNRQCPWPGHETIVFPGNLQGRHIRETGPKGCLLVSVDDDRHARAEFRPLDVFRWDRCTVDATTAGSGSDVLDLFADELNAAVGRSDQRPLAVRVEIVGASEAHNELVTSPERWKNEIRARAIHDAAERVWVEKVRLRTTPPLQSDLDSLDGPLGELLALVNEVRDDDVRLGELDCELADIRRKLASELKPEELNALAPSDPAWLKGVLEQIEHVLAGRLLHRQPQRPRGNS